MTPEEQVAEEVANRLQGKKKYVVSASEIVYYEAIIWAMDEDDANNLARDIENWGNPIDGSGFEICEITEYEESVWQQ